MNMNIIDNMNKTVYILAQIEVKDYKLYFKEYADKFNPILSSFEGDVLAATKQVEVIEGQSYGNWTVLIKFPSKQHAYNCINSESYAPLAALRINQLSTGGNVLLMESK